MKDSQPSKISSLSPGKKPLGQILIEAGLISISQIELALEEQKQNNLRIGEILVARGWISPKTIDFFCDRWLDSIEEKPKRPLAYYFQEAGLLDTEQYEAIVRLQKLNYKKVRFHHLAVEQGYLKKTTVDFFLTYLFKVYDPNAISLAKPYQLLKDYFKGEKNFPKTDLSKAPMMRVSLKGISLDGSSLRKADLSQANLSNSSLIQVNLSLANLSNAILTKVNFTRAFLTRANLRESYLEKANFQQAILHEVDFQSAYLALVNFAGADLTRAKLPLNYNYPVYYDSYTVFEADFDPEIMGWQNLERDRIKEV